MTQADALDILKLGRNVFLTGAAGSGKTFVLNQYIDYLKDAGVDGVAITASTGIAATHIGGMTIHAWSGLGIRDQISDSDIDALMEKQYIYKRFEKTTVLVIDEISMLSAKRLDMVEWICREMKRNSRAFGGLQVILCGDFFQLPPITRATQSMPMAEPSIQYGFGGLDTDPFADMQSSHVSGSRLQSNASLEFAYNSEAWKSASFTTCYLTEQHRQKDTEYLFVLNEIRANNVSQKTIDLLTSRQHTELAEGVVPTKLYTHNADVDTINSKHLGELTTKSGVVKEFVMRSTGNPFLVETLKKSCLAPERLRLTVGARVMCVKNNYEAGFVNGTLGVVTGFNTFGEPVIRTVSGKSLAITAMPWSIEEDGKVKAEITQIPLRLAWAITVHKSQGMSLDAMEVDLTKSFVKGMGYVALSRVRSLSGMKLLGFNPLALQVDPDVLVFDQGLQEISDEVVSDLRKMREGEKEKIQAEFLSQITPAKEKKEVKKSAREMTADMLAEGASLEDIADARGVKKETIISHIEDLRVEGVELDIEYLKHEFSYGELDEILTVFEDLDTTALAPVLTHLTQKKKKKVTYLKLRLARLFL